MWVIYWFTNMGCRHHSDFQLLIYENCWFMVYHRCHRVAIICWEPFDTSWNLSVKWHVRSDCANACIAAGLPNWLQNVFNYPSKHILTNRPLFACSRVLCTDGASCPYLASCGAIAMGWRQSYRNIRARSSVQQQAAAIHWIWFPTPKEETWTIYEHLWRILSTNRN